MITNHDIDDAIARVLEATTPNFVELTTIAGLDPAKDFRHANLSDIDFTGSNLAGFDFRGASFEGATFVNAKIAGAKFSRSAQLDNLLRCAVDADEVLTQDRLPLHRRRKRHRGKWSAVEATAVTTQNHLSVAERYQSKTLSHLPEFLLKPVTTRKSKAAIDLSDTWNPDLEDTLLWLDRNPESKSAALVIKRLVRLSCGRDEIVRRGLRWLETNSETIEALVVLILLLRLSGQEEAIQKLALRWLDVHPTFPKAADLLCVLLRVLPSNTIALRAFNWVDTNPHEGCVGNVLSSLIAFVGYEQLVKEKALRWINGDASVGAAANLLTSLLNANPTDETIREHCLSWLDQNPTAHSAAGVLIALLRCSKFDSQVRQFTLQWLAANWEWPYAAAVVDQMARCYHSGDDAWEYISKWIEANSGRKNLPGALRKLARQSGDRNAALL
jgi:hypothetical protein